MLELVRFGHCRRSSLFGCDVGGHGIGGRFAILHPAHMSLCFVVVVARRVHVPIQKDVFAFQFRTRILFQRPRPLGKLGAQSLNRRAPLRPARHHCVAERRMSISRLRNVVWIVRIVRVFVRADPNHLVPLFVFVDRARALAVGHDHHPGRAVLGILIQQIGNGADRASDEFDISLLHARFLDAIQRNDPIPALRATAGPEVI